MSIISMGAGWAFIRQMNDAIKNNRRLLGKRKSFKDLRTDEIKNRLSNFDNPNLDALEDRMALKSQEIDTKHRQSREKSLLIIILLPICIGVVGWFVYQGLTDHQKEINAIKPFKEKLHVNAEGVTIKSDYYFGGPLAARSELVNRLKHGESKSFYPTGELFRDAEYERGKLIWERYYFKSGEQINDFPRIVDQRKYKMELMGENVKMKFSFYDGKIIAKTFQEYATTNSRQK